MPEPPTKEEKKRLPLGGFGGWLRDRYVQVTNPIKIRLNTLRMPFSKKRFAFKRWTLFATGEVSIEKELRPLIDYNNAWLKKLKEIEEEYEEVGKRKEEWEKVFRTFGPYTDWKLIKKEVKYFEEGTGMESLPYKDSKGRTQYFNIPAPKILVHPDGFIEEVVAIGEHNWGTYTSYLKEEQAKFTQAGKEIPPAATDVYSAMSQLYDERLNAVNEIVEIEKKHLVELKKIQDTFSNVMVELSRYISEKSPRKYVKYKHDYYFVRPFLILEKDSEEYKEIFGEHAPYPPNLIEGWGYIENERYLVKDNDGNPLPDPAHKSSKGYMYKFIKVKTLSHSSTLLEKRDGEDIGLDENGAPLEVTPEGYVLLDVWEYGEFDKDKNDWIKNKSKTRRVHRKFITGAMYEGTFSRCAYLLESLNWINNEWDTVRDDLRDARYHPASRAVYDYEVASSLFRLIPRYFGKYKKDGKIDYSKFKSDEKIDSWYTWGPTMHGKKDLDGKPIDGKRLHLRVPTDINCAFDLRATDAGKYPHYHLGRRYYYSQPPEIFWEITKFVDKMEDLVNKRGKKPKNINEFEKMAERAKKESGADVNIDPVISTRGLAKYLIDRVLRDTKNFKEAVEVLHNIPLDYGRRDVNEDYTSIDKAMFDTEVESSFSIY